LVFSIAALALSDHQMTMPALPVASDRVSLTSGAFAVALIYVNYAYTGWNAATYLIDEIDSPERRLPMILIIGTLVVMGFYLLLNFVFLAVAPMDAMIGKV